MNTDTTYTPPVTEERAVKQWRKRVKDAKEHFDPDFKRIKENMEFAANIQWQGQTEIDDKDDRYIANIITNHINQKVASLYAKDPQCQATMRDRLNYQLWDGSVEQEWQAMQAVQQSAMMGMMTPQAVQAQQLLADITQGKQWEALCKRVCKTLEVLYGYQCDSQAPSFKYQMKQLVRRVITTGVGFVRLNFVTSNEAFLTSTMTDDSLGMRLKSAKSILAEVQEDDIDESDPRMEQLRLLLSSVQVSQQTGELNDVEERIEFDFPDSTAIIVDPRCKSFKGFIGAEWIAQQYIMPLSVANAYFELTGDKEVKVGGDFVAYADDTSEKVRETSANSDNDKSKDPMGCFWEVFDLTTKTHFFICDGWKWYVQEPAPLDVELKRFWPIFALTFNDIVIEPGMKVRVYPPSDVQLLKPIQKERNRSRQALREHRIGNKPFHWTMKGWMTENDRGLLANHETHQLIEMEGQPVNGDMKNSIGHWDGVPIDQALYNTSPLDEDANLAIGSNQVQAGAGLRHVAATPAVIQEQGRMNGVSSNVDDLDNLLEELAQSAGVIMLEKFSPQTVTRIVGRGAVWPQDNREDFLNSINLTIVAASSGRPNKAVDVQNAMQLGPLMMQAGANPWAMIKMYATVLDSNINPADFAPMTPPQPQGLDMVQTGQQGQQPQQPQAPNHPGIVGQHQGGQGMPVPTQQGGAH